MVDLAEAVVVMDFMPVEPEIRRQLLHLKEIMVALAVVAVLLMEEAGEVVELLKLVGREQLALLEKVAMGRLHLLLDRL
jgi:hypothetical protein